jgi:hypothetical protein
VTSPLVNSFRTSGPAIDLVAGGDVPFEIRAQVHEAWDAVRVRVSERTSVSNVKRAALLALLGSNEDAAQYMVKVHGHEVHDESLALGDAGVRAGTTVFVHSRRRRPVR